MERIGSVHFELLIDQATHQNLSKQDKTITTQRYAIFLNQKELIPIHLKLLIIRKRSNLSNDILGETFAFEISLEYDIIRFDKEITKPRQLIFLDLIYSLAIITPFLCLFYPRKLIFLDLRYSFTIIIKFHDKAHKYSQDREKHHESF